MSALSARSAPSARSARTTRTSRALVAALAGAALAVVPGAAWAGDAPTLPATHENVSSSASPWLTAGLAARQTVTITHPVDGQTVAPGTIAFTGRGAPGTTLRAYFSGPGGGDAGYSADVTESGRWMFAATFTEPGTYTFGVWDGGTGMDEVTFHVRAGA